MESNVQKIREAARHLLCVIEEMGFKPWCADDPLAIACDRLDTALAEPLLNCNVGTAEEWIRRHERYCGDSAESFACINGPGSECKKCFAKWLQMPYEEGGAE